MSTVGCYTLHVYCDVSGCDSNMESFGSRNGQYTGRNETEALSKARDDGWKIDSKKTGDERAIFCGGRYALCPKHHEEWKHRKRK